MDTDRWQRLRALFDEAAEIDPAQRTAFVAAQCEARGFDAAMREELHALLATLDAAAAQPAAPLWQAAPDLLVRMEADTGAREHRAMLGRRIGASARGACKARSAAAAWARCIWPNEPTAISASRARSS